MCLKLIRLFLFVVVVAICSVVVGCAPKPPLEIPEELIGVWITEAPGWEDRFLKLEERAIHFGIGGDQAIENPVIGVESEPSEEGHTLYRIKYLSPEGFEYVKPLFYDAERGEIRYRNRPSVVWKRADFDIKPAQALGLTAGPEEATVRQAVTAPQRLQEPICGGGQENCCVA